MTDKDIMNHRFHKKNINKSTGVLAEMLGMKRKDYEAACERVMKQEAKEMKVGGK